MHVHIEEEQHLDTISPHACLGDRQSQRGSQPNRKRRSHDATSNSAHRRRCAAAVEKVVREISEKSGSSARAGLRVRFHPELRCYCFFNPRRASKKGLPTQEHSCSPARLNR
jgi:hypothetical protein